MGCTDLVQQYLISHFFTLSFLWGQFKLKLNLNLSLGVGAEGSERG